MVDFVASDYSLDDRATGVHSPGKVFPLACVQTSSEAHPATCQMGTGGSFPGRKARPGRDADHSIPYSAEVKNWVGTILSPKRLHCVPGQLYFYSREYNYSWVEFKRIIELVYQSIRRRPLQISTISSVYSWRYSLIRILVSCAVSRNG
jgi:hypothetical protein